MLGQIAPEADLKKVYLNIKDGAVVKRTPQGEERYSFVEGKLEGITQRERTFRGTEVVLYWYMDLRDADSGELYSLGFPFASNTFKSIILQVASEKGLEAVKSGLNVKIEPYKKNGYDKVQVYAGGARLDWAVKQLPPVEEKLIGGRSIKDDTKRMELITSLVENIRKEINRNFTN